MLRSIIASSAVIALSVIGFYYAVDLNAVWTYLLQADYSYLPLVLVLRALPIISRTGRFAVLLGSFDQFKKIYHAEALSYLFNNILPFRAGEIAAVALLRATMEIRVSRILSAMALDRLLDVIFLALLLLSTLPFVPVLPPMIGYSLTIVGLVSGAMFAAMMLALRFQSKFSRLCHHILHKLAPSKVDIWLDRLNEGVEGVNLLGSPARLAQAIFYTIMSWLWIILSLQVTAWAFGLHPDWIATIFATCVSVLGGAVVSTPGGLGVMHATIVVSYGLFGIPAAQTLAVAVILHAASAFVAVVVGGISLYLSGQPLGKLFQRRSEP